MKVILIIVVFIVGAMLITILGQATGHTKGGGPIGIVITVGIFAAARAIWRYNPESEQTKDTTADKQSLDKNS